MSLAELKEQVIELSPKDRFQLAAFLGELEEQSETEFRAEVDKRMKAMDAGRKITAEELEERHQALRSQGR